MTLKQSTSLCNINQLKQTTSENVKFQHIEDRVSALKTKWTLPAFLEGSAHAKQSDGRRNAFILRSV